VRLSVCIITYNHEEFVEQAITSVLNQEVSFDYEIVVGQDCSTDSTAEVLRRLVASNPGRLKVENREKNLGSRENFTKTLAACQGEYIAFLEGDDFWTSRHKLELQVGFLDQHKEASFCFHRTRSLNAMDQSVEFVLPPYDPPTLSSIDFLLQESNPVAINSVVARRTCLTDLSSWLADIKPGDWPLCLMLARQGRVGYLPMEMSRYRVHAGGSWSHLSPYLRVAYVIRMLSHVSRLLSGEEKNLVEQRKAELAGWWAGELICNPSMPLDVLLSNLNRVGNCELSTYLLSQTMDKARNVQQARLWHEQQSEAWEAAAAYANEQLARLDAKVAEYAGRTEIDAAARTWKWLAGFRPRKKKHHHP